MLFRSKAYTYQVSESQTGTLLTGSGMVESMSLTTVAGLAAAAPGAKRAAKKALEAIRAVEAVIVSGEDINIAVTLKSLKTSIDELPATLAKEGANPAIVRTINEISDRLRKLGGDQGYDFTDMVQDALAESPTVKDINSKTEAVSDTVDVLQQVLETKMGGLEDPIVLDDIQ